jgi:hypothetical protein
MICDHCKRTLLVDETAYRIERVQFVVGGEDHPVSKVFNACLSCFHTFPCACSIVGVLMRSEARTMKQSAAEDARRLRARIAEMQASLDVEIRCPFCAYGLSERTGEQAQPGRYWVACKHCHRKQELPIL